MTAICYIRDACPLKFKLAESIGVTDKELFFQRYEEINKVLWQRYERGEITKDTLRSLRFRETFIIFCEENGRFAQFGKTSEEQQTNITSFSSAPLHIITALGFVLFALGGVCTLATLILMLWIGWLWFLVSVLFMLTGLQLFAIGLVGQYVGKIYAEVKKRPRFIVEETLMR